MNLSNWQWKSSSICLLALSNKIVLYILCYNNIQVGSLDATELNPTVSLYNAQTVVLIIETELFWLQHKQ